MTSDPHELLTAWQRRWRPIARRLLRNGHRFNPAHLQETLRLVLLIDRGDAQACSLANWGRSHHFSNCPFSNRRNPISTLDRSPEAQWASPR